MTNGNDLAFPEHIKISSGVHGETTDQFVSGLTKREWFAGLAMQGILSGELPKNLVVGGAKDEKEWLVSIAIMAVEFSDLLIEVLNKPKEPK